jgi:hypothetical protein
MQRLEVSGAVRHIYIHIYISLGGKGLETQCSYDKGLLLFNSLAPEFSFKF